VTNGTLRLNKAAGVNAINGPLTIGQSGVGDPTAAVVLLNTTSRRRRRHHGQRPRHLDTNGFDDTIRALPPAGS
jgi:hypothetical protein